VSLLGRDFRDMPALKAHQLQLILAGLPLALAAGIVNRRCRFAAVPT